MKLKVKANQKDLKSKVVLPVSKSFANRYFLMKYMAGDRLFEKSENYPDDVNVLLDVLNQTATKKNTRDAGTVMRFSTALLSTVEGYHELIGEGRMYQRPIGILVDALRVLGAEIEYMQAEGFPPLSLQGKALKGGSLKVPAHISSQFISALLMIAPTCKEAVDLELEGLVVSEPYIELTLELMRQMGIVVEQHKHVFKIRPQAYKKRVLEIEKDWSSAAFIYQLCALSESAEIQIPELRLQSLQGDKTLIQLFEHLGVTTIETKEGLKIVKRSAVLKSELEIDFTHCPDLVQAVVLTCLGLGIQLRLRGLYNLHLKESNRLDALKYNVQVLGGSFEYTDDRAQLIPSKKLETKGDLKTFSDHRMLMSLAPLALKLGEVNLQETEVASKSFPQYWVILKELGFELIENH